MCPYPEVRSLVGGQVSVGYGHGPWGYVGYIYMGKYTDGDLVGDLPLLV
jgi:hypothetical protein